MRQGAISFFERDDIVFLFAGKIFLFQNDLIVDGLQQFLKECPEFQMFSRSQDRFRYFR